MWYFQVCVFAHVLFYYSLFSLAQFCHMPLIAFVWIHSLPIHFSTYFIMFIIHFLLISMWKRSLLLIRLEYGHWTCHSHLMCGDLIFLCWMLIAFSLWGWKLVGFYFSLCMWILLVSYLCLIRMFFVNFQFIFHLHRFIHCGTSC